MPLRAIRGRSTSWTHASFHCGSTSPTRYPSPRLPRRHPTSSVLINNAGILRGASVLDPDTSKLREEMETNLFGPLAMASAFADRIAQRSGAIVNVASVLAWFPVGASYGVTKAAMWSATDSMRLELGSRGVQVVGVYVGLVDTDMASFADGGKSDPADVVRQILDGIESGADEVLADDMTRGARADLSKPIRERLG